MRIIKDMTCQQIGALGLVGCVLVLLNPVLVANEGGWVWLGVLVASLVLLMVKEERRQGKP